jgi:hypothetical protein
MAQAIVSREDTAWNSTRSRVVFCVDVVQPKKHHFCGGGSSRSTKGQRIAW